MKVCVRVFAWVHLCVRVWVYVDVRVCPCMCALTFNKRKILNAIETAEGRNDTKTSSIRVSPSDAKVGNFMTKLYDSFTGSTLSLMART